MSLGLLPWFQSILIFSVNSGPSQIPCLLPGSGALEGPSPWRGWFDICVGSICYAECGYWILTRCVCIVLTIRPHWVCWVDLWAPLHRGDSDAVSVPFWPDTLCSHCYSKATMTSRAKCILTKPTTCLRPAEAGVSSQAPLGPPNLSGDVLPPHPPTSRLTWPKIKGTYAAPSQGFRGILIPHLLSDFPFSSPDHL